MISKASEGSTEKLKNTILTAREVGGEGFVDMVDEEHIEEHKEVLTKEELEDLVKSSTEEDEETEVEPAMWTLGKNCEVFRMAQNLKEKIMDYDPLMKRSIKVTV